MRTVLIALLITIHVFAKRLLAFLAHEDHLGRLPQTVILRLSMAFRAVEPLPATWGAYGNLRIQDMFAGQKEQVQCTRSTAEGPREVYSGILASHCHVRAAAT